MVKIIENGDPNRKTRVVYTAKCPYCGCVFEFEEEDFPFVVKEDGLRSHLCCMCCHASLDEERHVTSRIEVFK